MENKCKVCDKKTRNKVYCSVDCQHKGYKKLIVDRIKKNCLFCDKEFRDTEYRINVLGKKYCSRKCKDEHQKYKYVGDGNPSFEREMSLKEKKMRSKMAKKMWENEGHKEKVQIGQKRFKKENGFWPGTDENSKTKRRETCLKKYGVDHNWKDKKVREKCDKTTIKKYGKTGLEMAIEGLFKYGETSIEKIIKNLLRSNKIKYKKNFYIFFNEKEHKIYDFYLPDYNLLLEADGDYWHGNPVFFKSLNEIQQINKKNDKFKNELAKQEGYFLIRFWENEIKEKNFKESLLKSIKEYGQKNKNKEKN